VTGSLGLILLSLILAPLAVGWTLQRVGIRWGAWVSAFGHMVARVVAIVVLFLMIVQAVDEGGAWFALAAALGIFALGMLALLALRIWALLKFGVHADEMT
jgi:hypothetical protein